MSWFFLTMLLSKLRRLKYSAIHSQTHLIALINGLNDRKITQGELLEASRLQLIRVFSMGLTGFDTPGSLNALDEARVSLEAMEIMLSPVLKKVIERLQMSSRAPCPGLYNTF